MLSYFLGAYRVDSLSSWMMKWHSVNSNGLNTPLPHSFIPLFHSAMKSVALAVMHVKATKGSSSVSVCFGSWAVLFFTFTSFHKATKPLYNLTVFYTVLETLNLAFQFLLASWDREGKMLTIINVEHSWLDLQS